MEYRYLGRSGLQVSALGLGGNNFGKRVDAEHTSRVIQQALDLGVNLIDTANIYGGQHSEGFIGKALKKLRHRVVLATKVSLPVGEGPNQRGASRRHIMEQVEISLRRLQTEFIDLYQIHCPDPATPIEETLRALDELVHQGKVRYIGCSNFAAWQVCEAVWTSRILNLASFVSVQPEYNLIRREIEQELVPFCKAYNIGIIPYFPLASGFLTGKYRAGEPLPQMTRFATDPQFQWHRQHVLTERNFALMIQLEQFAQDRGHTVGELAIAWLLANPLVSSVIAGAMNEEQVIANAKGVDWSLTTQEMEEIRVILTGDSDGYE